MQKLTAMVNRQDSLMKNLKKKVSDALTNFEGKGLSVVNKNGRVYVSMDEKLLFKSGSYDVDSKGIQALNSIGDFLAQYSVFLGIIARQFENVKHKLFYA